MNAVGYHWTCLVHKMWDPHALMTEPVNVIAIHRKEMPPFDL